MSSQQLIDYIKQAQTAGQSKEQIRAALLGSGWQEADVDDALSGTVFSAQSAVSGVSHSSKLIIIVVSLAVVLFIAGGGFAYYFYFYESARQEPMKAEPQQQDQVNQIAKEESILDILAKAERLESVQFEASSTIVYMSNSPINENATHRPIISKIWQKLPYMRVESKAGDYKDGNVIEVKYIVRPEGVYFYDSSKDKYQKMPTTQTQNQDRSLFLSEFSQEAKENSTLKVLGMEVINDKPTTIIEYATSSNGFFLKQKAWIWNEKGVPLKTEIISRLSSFTATTVTEHKNFIFNDIPDSVFEVSQDRIHVSSDATSTTQTLDLSQSSYDSQKRDDARRINAQTLTTAMAIYMLDQQKEVAVETSFDCPEGWFVDAQKNAGCMNLEAGDPPFNVYIKKLPSDQNPDTYVYNNQDVDATFCLGVKLEKSNSRYICNSAGCREQEGVIFGADGTRPVVDCPEG